jgi:hypothetical protein
MVAAADDALRRARSRQLSQGVAVLCIRPSACRATLPGYNEEPTLDG